MTLVFKLKNQIFHQSFLLATINVRYLINYLPEALLKVMVLAVLTAKTAVVPLSSVNSIRNARNSTASEGNPLYFLELKDQNQGQFKLLEMNEYFFTMSSGNFKFITKFLRLDGGNS